MIDLPSPRPARMAMHVCRMAGIGYIMVGIGVVGSLLFGPAVGNVAAGHDGLIQVKAGV